MTAQNKVWLVTGASGGLGLATVKELLAAGYPVAATTRDVKKLRAAVGGAYGAAQFLPLAMQVTDEADVQRGIEAVRPFRAAGRGGEQRRLHPGRRD